MLTLLLPELLSNLSNTVDQTTGALVEQYIGGDYQTEAEQAEALAAIQAAADLATAKHGGDSGVLGRTAASHLRGSKQWKNPHKGTSSKGSSSSNGGLILGGLGLLALGFLATRSGK